MTTRKSDARDDIAAILKLTSPAEFVMLIASILANYALLPRREGLCVLMMADD